GWNLVDLDGDGRLDLFLSAHGQPALAALGDGAGHFALAAGTYPMTEIHIPYDIDEDGKLDLSMTYQDGGGQWWKNGSTPGLLAFTGTSITRATNQARMQVMVDINRDGNVDWVRYDLADGLIYDYGDGKGGFASRSKVLGFK